MLILLQAWRLLLLLNQELWQAKQTTVVYYCHYIWNLFPPMFKNVKLQTETARGCSLMEKSNAHNMNQRKVSGFHVLWKAVTSNSPYSSALVRRGSVRQHDMYKREP